VSFGGPTNPYQPPQGAPNGGPYPPPPPPPPSSAWNAGPHVPPPYGYPQGPNVPPPYGYPQAPNVPPPYGYPPAQGMPPQYPPHPNPYPYPYPNPYVPQPQPSTSLFGMLRDLRGAEWPPLRVLLRGGRTRIHGCVWAVLLFPCTWFVIPPLLAGYSFVRSARATAHRLFPPRGERRIEDPHVTRVQKARAWTAIVMSLLLLAAYGRPEDIGEAEKQYFMRLVITPPLLLLSAPVVIAVLFRWASPEARARMRPRMRAAGRAALWYVGAVTAVPLLIATMAWADPGTSSTARTGSDFPWLALAATIPCFWLMFFLGFATGPAVRTGFNSAGVHAALPALLTGVLVWEFALISLAAGGLPPGPPLIKILAFLGGPASVTAVAWWEIHRLRTRYGVRLRG
jgi:hypothetical protein